jgi:hypothetical protein
MAQNQKREQSLKGQGRNHTQIDGGDRLRVVSKEYLPALRRRCPAPHHVFGDCRLGDLKAKHQEFAMDPGRTPLLVFLAHPSNEITQATIDLRAPCPLSGFPAPESFEARAMPPKDGLRLNHLGQAEQARPETGHPYQQHPVTAAQSKTRRRTPQGDAELMTEKQVLGLKQASRLEQVGDEHSERVQDCKHRLG